MAAEQIVYAAHVRPVSHPARPIPVALEHDQRRQPQTPEEAFVTSIIMQAYRDLFVSIPNESNASFTTQSDQDQAITFLTDKVGAFPNNGLG